MEREEEGGLDDGRSSCISAMMVCPAEFSRPVGRAICMAPPFPAFNTLDSSGIEVH